MAYVETGPKTGEPVVLIHGYTDNIRIWSPAMIALHKRDPGLHIFAVDLRGHGASTMPPLKSCAPAPENCFQIRDFARDIVAFLTKKAVPKATLIGHSLGSLVVQEVALSHPEMVERAVLVSTTTKVTFPPGFDFPPFTSWRKTLEAKGKKYPTEFYNLTPKDVGPEAIEWIYKDYVVDAAVDQTLGISYARSISRVRLGTWLGAARGSLAFDSTKRLGELAMPTLVLWGSQDPLFPDPDQNRLRDALDAAARSHDTTSYWKQYGVRPLPKPNEPQTDIGHNVQWDAPDMAAADIDSFIRHGAPTSDLIHSDAPPNTAKMIVEPGKATVIRLGG
jgi:pimeloyl-ACP methyl ester carboxylesterase